MLGIAIAYKKLVLILEHLSVLKICEFKSCFPGDSATTTTPAPSVDFFDNAFTFSNHSSNITCCKDDNTSEEATCGQGVSCAGQCSALGASLCPSGDCTDFPGTCNLDFGGGKDERSGRSTDSHTGSDLDWCTNAKHQCKVRKHKDCCYSKKCLKWDGRLEACSWLNFLTGKWYEKEIKKIWRLKWQHFRQNMSIPWNLASW